MLETFLAFQNIDLSLASLHRLVAAGGVVTSYRLAVEGGAAGPEGGAAFELSVAAVQAKFAEILGGKAADYDKDSPLAEYGLDSLSSIEVRGYANLGKLRITDSDSRCKRTCALFLVVMCYVFP